MIKKSEVECDKCNHKWNTSSKLKTVTCPSCQLKINNPYFNKDCKEVKNENNKE